MPEFDVTTTKTTRLTAPDIGAAAEMVVKIEDGNMAPPPGLNVSDAEVLTVRKVVRDR